MPSPANLKKPRSSGGTAGVLKTALGPSEPSEPSTAIGRLSCGAMPRNLGALNVSSALKVNLGLGEAGLIVISRESG